MPDIRIPSAAARAAGLLRQLLCLATLAGTATAAIATEPAAQWPTVGGSTDSQRYTPLAEVTKANVTKLKPAWTFNHGDFSKGNAEHGATALQVTPLVIGDTMFFCTPYNRVIALDAASGKQRWSFDPKVRLKDVYTPVCRGVAHWQDAKALPGSACAARIFMGTLDARLVSVDARSGKACDNFGKSGDVNLLDGLGDVRSGEYYVTSAPLVVDDLVITGAFVKDGQRLDAPGGAIRAFDARSGELRWVWDPVPPQLKPVTAADVKKGKTLTRGTPNVWALMSADPAAGIVYVPTGNPQPDHYGGPERGDLDHYGSSLVALDAKTGAVRWHFQTVHHDLWDYDLAAQPVLYRHRGQGRDVPAVIAATKLGFIFLLDRLTGAPLFPVQEKPVPKSKVPGIGAAPTQPFPTKPAPLHPLALKREDLWGFTPLDRGKCREIYDGLNYEGVFTPPSTKPTLQYPGLGGGINWGSVSVDPVRNRMIVNLQTAPFTIQLTPRKDYKAALDGSDLVGTGPQEGTPYVVTRGPFISPYMTPCTPPPWGKLVAIDLNSGDKLWERELGNLNNLAPLIGDWLDYGTPNSGGSLQTASGLVFIAATMDKYLRAFDSDNGSELWRHELPFAAHAAPLSYRVSGKGGAKGRQFIAIAAGGHGPLGTEPGDAIVAFTLGE